jgi:hypothetical protein
VADSNGVAIAVGAVIGGSATLLATAVGHAFQLWREKVAYRREETQRATDHIREVNQRTSERLRSEYLAVVSAAWAWHDAVGSVNLPVGQATPGISAGAGPNGPMERLEEAQDRVKTAVTIIQLESDIPETILNAHAAIMAISGRLAQSMLPRTQALVDYLQRATEDPSVAERESRPEDTPSTEVEDTQQAIRTWIGQFIIQMRSHLASLAE